jgi:hypothetical protein
MRAARKQLAKLIAQNSARQTCALISLTNSSASDGNFFCESESLNQPGEVGQKS